jgi:hypothetical protein
MLLATLLPSTAVLKQQLSATQIAQSSVKTFPLLYCGDGFPIS